jgi:PAP2 superfamily
VSRGSWWMRTASAAPAKTHGTRLPSRRSRRARLTGTLTAALSARAREARWRDLWDVGAGVLAFGGYLAVAARSPTRLARANANARQVVALERWLGLPSERPANVWTASHHLLTSVANYEYASGYLASTLATLAWLRLTKPPEYARHVLSLLGINVVAVGVFAGYPVTPPRLLAGAGFVDTVTNGRTVGSWGTGMISATANEHAAMPSLHVAWTTWVAATLLAQDVPRWLRRAAVLHVGTTTAVIVMTGNHWLLDAVAGVAVAATVDHLVAGVFRARKEVGLPHPPAPAPPVRPGPVPLAACSSSSR